MTDVEPIKRYEIAAFATHTGDSWFEEYESEDGDYVKYEDHKRELDAEKARADEAESSDSESMAMYRRVRDRLDQLLCAVERKFPGETRFETALRYIREAETQEGGSAQATPQPTSAAASGEAGVEQKNQQGDSP